MQERQTISPTPDQVSGEPISPIAQERQILQRERSFFSGRDNKDSFVGVLTTSDVRALTSVYPQIVRGMLMLYDYMEKPFVSGTDAERTLSRYLAQRLMSGELISNDEIANIKKDINEGQYSEQLAAYEDYQRRTARQPRNEDQQRTPVSSARDELRNILRGTSDDASHGDFRPIRDEDDVIFNKRQVLVRVLGVQSVLQNLYGEVDYRKALFTELLLGAFFADAVVSGEQFDDEARERHSAYLKEAIEFSDTFDPTSRFNQFDEITQEYSTTWTEETASVELPDFDREYVRRVYELGGSLMSGNVAVEELYSLLGETILRRGRVFTASAVERRNRVTTEIKPTELEEVSFDVIGGYEEQKGFYRTLLRKTEEHDPIVEDVGIVIAAGKPGVGKSLGVRVFLSNLPDNAKGIIVERSSGFTIRGDMPQHEALIRLAKLHPELQIFAVMEDMDILASRRMDNMTNMLSGQLLDIDSVVPDTLPPNLHIIGTTNRLEMIDSAVTRPGRTSKILIYDTPKDASDRVQVARIHARLKGLDIADETLDLIARKSSGFTPDEVRHIVWSLRFDGVEQPNDKDIDKYVDEIKRKHRLEKDRPGFKTGIV